MKNVSSKRDPCVSTVGDDPRFKRAALAMAYVPWQSFESNYCSEMALQRGTLFASLDKPFRSAREVYRNA